MNSKFTLGLVAGAASLAIAVPAIAQFASAQSEDASSSSVQAEADDVDPLDVPDRDVDPRNGGHVGADGNAEELLTGDDADKASTAALAAVPGGTIDRVETDAEGDAYEAHITKDDGSRVTVKFDEGFDVTKVETGPDGGRGRGERDDDDDRDDALGD